MANVVTDQIACDNWLYTNNFTTSGSNSYACPPKSVITGTYNLSVSGTYADNQLVKQSDISIGLKQIPFYVIFNWHNVPYSSRWVYYQGRNVMPIYCNVQTGVNGAGSVVTASVGGNSKNYEIYMNTSVNPQGDFQALPCDSSSGTLEWCMNMDTNNFGSPSFNGFAAPGDSTIYGIDLRGLYITFYDSSNNSIGTSGSVTTNFAYQLKLAINQWGYWQELATSWGNQYSSNSITSSMVGYSEQYTLNASSINVPVSNLSGSNRGVAIMFDFIDLYGGSSGGNSSW